MDKTPITEQSKLTTNLELSSEKPNTIFKLTSEGELQFKGQVTNENADVVNTLLNQAVCYRDIAAKLEAEKQKTQSRNEFVLVIFCASILSMIAFLGYIAISAVVDNQQVSPQPKVSEIQKDGYIC